MKDQIFVNGTIGSFTASVFKDPKDSLWKVDISDTGTTIVGKTKNVAIFLAEQTFNSKFKPFFIKEK